MLRNAKREAGRGDAHAPTAADDQPGHGVLARPGGAAVKQCIHGVLALCLVAAATQAHAQTATITTIQTARSIHLSNPGCAGVNVGCM